MKHNTQEFSNFLLTCKQTNLDYNEKNELKNMQENCAYYYGPYIQFFYQNKLYVTRVTEFSKQMLIEAGYAIYKADKLSNPVPVHNYSGSGIDLKIIKNCVENCLLKIMQSYLYTGTVIIWKNNSIDAEATRSRLASDPKVRDFIYKSLLENNDLRYIYSLNGDKIFNDPNSNALLSQIVSLDTETFKHYLAFNSSYLYFTPEQRKKSEYLEFFENNVMYTVDRILESYCTQQRSK